MCVCVCVCVSVPVCVCQCVPACVWHSPARWTTPLLAGLCCTKYGTLTHPLRDTAQPSTRLHTVQDKAPSIVRQCPPHSQDSCTHNARQCIPQPLQVTVRVIAKTLPPPIYK